jgi:hypothetical protein
MDDRFPMALPMAALILSLASCPATAQSSVTPAPASCAAMADRAIGLRTVPARKSLSDLTIAVAGGQEKKLSLVAVSVLEGPCAEGVHAFRMSQVEFEDGAVYTARSDDRFVYAPDVAGLRNLRGDPLETGQPAIDRARLIMAANVDSADGANGKRSLDVGLWQTTEGYLLAAYARHGDGFGTPVELVRSRLPLKSVTYFPSADSNSGRLGLVQDTGSGIALVSLDWDHSALSKTLRSVK